MKKIYLFLLLILLGVMISSPALASSFLDGLQSTGSQVTELSPASPQLIIAMVVKTLLSLIGVIFVGLIVYGGFIYMTAAGTDEKIKKSKNIILTSVIGLLIIISGYSITSFITNTLENPGQTSLPAYREECENAGSLDFYSLNCCEYRFLINGTVDSSCCDQSYFKSNHDTECP